MHIKRLLAIGVAVIGTPALPSFAAGATLRGAFALPGMTEKVTAELVVRETGPLTRELRIAFADKTTGQPITHFDEELTQALHVLATDSGFSSFVHEHAGKPGLGGRFRVAMRFPKPGTCHVYADAVPRGLGQQVIRFEVPVDITTGPTAQQQAPVAAAEGSDGRYTVKLNASALRSDREHDGVYDPEGRQTGDGPWALSWSAGACGVREHRRSRLCSRARHGGGLSERRPRLALVP